MSGATPSHGPSRRAASRRLGASVAILLVAILAAACGDAQPPGPTPTGGPDASGVPSGSGAPPSGAPAVEEGERLPLVAAGATTELWGIYANERVAVSAGEYGASIQAAMPCTELLALLAASEWTVAADLEIPSLAPEASAGSGSRWVLLERAGATVYAQLGGDAASCGGRLVRSSPQPVEASGAYTVRGEAEMTQLMCIAGGGSVQASFVYDGPDGHGAILLVETALRTGTQALTPESKVSVSVGRGSASLRRYFEAMREGLARGAADEVEFEVGDGFFPGPSFRGELEIASVDPLVGTVRLEGLTDERGRSQSFTAGFRCDLPPGRLAAAAEGAPDATPAPAPTASPRPGALTVEVAGGPRKGTYRTDGGELTCVHGVMGDEQWWIMWSPDGEPGPGDLSGVTLQFAAPFTGGSSSTPDVTITAGDPADFDSFLSIGSTLGGGRSGRGTATLERAGEGATVTMSGATADGYGITITADCGRVEGI